MALNEAGRRFPVLIDALLEVKACVLSGCLPEPGALLDQTGGYDRLVRWLASRGILEGLVRPSM